MHFELLVFSSDSLHEVFLFWHILWLKRGRKGYINTPYTIYACVFCIYFAELSVIPLLCICLYYCCCIHFATISELQNKDYTSGFPSWLCSLQSRCLCHRTGSTNSLCSLLSCRLFSCFYLCLSLDVETLIETLQTLKLQNILKQDTLEFQYSLR